VIALTPTLRFYGCEPAGFAIVLSFEHVHDRSLSDRDVEARHEWDDSTLARALARYTGRGGVDVGIFARTRWR
jgi:hypothetical protein